MKKKNEKGTYANLINHWTLFFVIAEKNEIPLGDWFVSPIHPVTKEFEKWDLDINRYENAKYLSQRVVNLPTDIDDVNKVLSFLERQKKEKRVNWQMLACYLDGKIFEFIQANKDNEIVMKFATELVEELAEQFNLTRNL